MLCLVWTPSFLFAKLNLLSLFPRFPSGCSGRAVFGAGCAALVRFLILVLVLVFLIAACRAAVPLLAAAPLLRPAGARTCGDAGYQSDWSQTYEGHLCHRFKLTLTLTLTIILYRSVLIMFHQPS